jgi:hypothetical protein
LSGLVSNRISMLVIPAVCIDLLDIISVCYETHSFKRTTTHRLCEVLFELFVQLNPLYQGRLIHMLSAWIVFDRTLGYSAFLEKSPANVVPAH